MKSKCEYCGSYLDDGEENCPNCGALNPGYKRTAEGVPTTIEELKKWYVDHNLPDESVTRFFIGKDIRTAKAFGIYQDEETGKFIVYKNKSDGVRVVRYKGTDEKYAVNELYLKLKEEMVNQKQRNNSANVSKVITPEEDREARRTIKKVHKLNLLIIIIVICFMIVFINLISSGPSKGYYEYNDNYYYYQSGVWYEYDDDLGWYKTSVDDEFEDNYDDYYVSSYYSSSYDTEDFSDTDYYVESSSSSSSGDSDWDCGWDSSSSWDSSSTDWDSDW